MNNSKEKLFEPKIIGEEEAKSEAHKEKKLLDNDELMDLDKKIVEPRIQTNPNELKEESVGQTSMPSNKGKNNKKLLAIYVTLAIIVGLVVLYFVVFNS